MLVSRHGGPIVTERGRYAGVILFGDVTATLQENGQENGESGS